MPLYDILNEFQKGLSHMAVVIHQQKPESGMADHSHSISKHSSEGEHHFTHIDRLAYINSN